MSLNRRELPSSSTPTLELSRTTGAMSYGGSLSRILTHSSLMSSSNVFKSLIQRILPSCNVAVYCIFLKVHDATTRFTHYQNNHIPCIEKTRRWESQSLSHTPEVHLNPDPNATWSTRSPFFSRFVVCISWIYSSSYQILELLVLP